MRLLFKQLAAAVIKCRYAVIFAALAAVLIRIYTYAYFVIAWAFRAVAAFAYVQTSATKGAYFII